MANPVKGEVEAVDGGRPLCLVLDAEALCGLEHAFGRPAQDVVAGWYGPDGAFLPRAPQRLEAATLILWAALRRHHPDYDPTAAAELLARLGELALAVVVGVVVQAFPAAETGPPAPKPEGKAWDFERLLRLWIELDLGTMEAFWRCTPRMLKLALDGARQREVRRHNQRAWLAHTTAALGRFRDFPKLDSLLRSSEPKRPQTWQDQLAIAEAFTALAQARAKRRGGGKAPSGGGTDAQRHQDAEPGEGEGAAGEDPGADQGGPGGAAGQGGQCPRRQHGKRDPGKDRDGEVDDQG